MIRVCHRMKQFVENHTPRHMCVVVNFDALAHASDIRIESRQVVFLAKCRIRTQGPRHQIASRLNARWQTDWAITDQAKNLNSTARHYGVDSTWRNCGCISHSLLFPFKYKTFLEKNHISIFIDMYMYMYLCAYARGHLYKLTSKYFIHVIVKLVVHTKVVYNTVTRRCLSKRVYTIYTCDESLKI